MISHLNLSSFLACAAALTTGAAAQTIPVTPVSNVNTEGKTISLATANNDFHLTQTIYESTLVYRPQQQWNTLLLRPDNSGSFGNFVAFQRRLTIRLSGVGVPSPELASQTSFSANHGSDLTTVLADKVVSFPAHTPAPGGPAAFSVRIPLDVPFSTNGIVHLLSEIETKAQAGGPTQWRWYPDAEGWLGQDWTILTSTFGTGCGPTAQSYSASATGNTLRTLLRFARTPGYALTHPALAWIGTSKTQWGPLSLPLPVFGVPGCAINAEPLAVFFGQTGGGSGEGFSLSVPVPRNYGLLGKTVFSQTMVFDEGGLRASEGAEFFFSSPPSPYRALTLRRMGSPGDAVQFVQPDRAIVLGVQ